MTTHYIPYFTSSRPNQMDEAVCGAWVEKRQHSAEPTCPQCSAWLLQDAKDTKEIGEAVGVNFIDFGKGRSDNGQT